MIAQQKNRLYLALAVILGLGLTISLVLYALRSNIDLFYTPGEIIYGKGPDAEKPEIGYVNRASDLFRRLYPKLTMYS